MLITVNSIFQIIFIFIGTFLIERYVLLEPALEPRKQQFFYAFSFITVTVAYFIINDASQYFVLILSGLNIFLGRKTHKIMGFLMVIPIIGIMNGVSAPLFLVPLCSNNDYYDTTSQVSMFIIYLIIMMLLVLFYIEGKDWRKWFSENMKNRKPNLSEHILIYVSGFFLMIFSSVSSYVMNPDTITIPKDIFKEIRLLFIAYNIAEFILSISIIVMMLQGNKRKFYHDQVAKMQFNIIATMADLVENRDDNTGGHIRRTAKYVEIIGKKLKSSNTYPEVLTDSYLSDMIIAAPLHDIGKIHIPDAILNKPGRLTDEEFSIMKTHTTAGYEVLKKANKQLGGFNYLNLALDMAEYHHEWWNGKGYPNAISGEDIPLCARIMAVADVFDALISKRCYKDAMPLDTAYHIISEESGTHFDPKVVEAFLTSKKEVEIEITNFANEKEDD